MTVTAQQLKNALEMAIEDEANEFDDIDQEELGRIEKHFRSLVDTLTPEAKEPEDS